MKNIVVKFVVFLVLSSIITSCQLVEDILPENQEYESFVADISENTDFDVLTYAEEDNSFFAVKLNETAILKLAIVKPNDATEPFPIWFSADGYPEKMIIDEFVFSFDNFSEESFDMGIITPDGEVSVVRDILIPEEYQDFNELKSISWSDGLRWAGHITGAVACAASIAAGAAGTASTVGIAAPAAAALITVGCGATALAIATEFFPEEIQEFTGLSATALSTFSTVTTCINFTNPAGAISCFSGLLSATITGASAIVESHQNELALVNRAVEGGYGEIQVTLTWDSSADIDLYVKDPLEELIWFDNKTSASGGRLDIDDTNGYGPENIFWERNSAPSGTYQVFVKHYSGNSANYSILVQAYGRIKQYEGHIERGEDIFITEFSEAHLKSISRWHVYKQLPTIRK